MANSKSAAKRARQTARRSARNRQILSHLRTLQKRPADAGSDASKSLISAIDKAAKRGKIHRNAATRRKARLARAQSAAGAK